jgi:hypothetical protein
MTALAQIESRIAELNWAFADAIARQHLGDAMRIEDRLEAWREAASIVRHAEPTIERLDAEELLLRLESALEARMESSHEAQLCRRARQVAYAAIAEQARQESGL